MINSLIAIAFTPILGINIINNKDVSSDFVNKYINIFFVSWFIILKVKRYLEMIPSPHPITYSFKNDKQSLNKYDGIIDIFMIGLSNRNINEVNITEAIKYDLRKCLAILSASVLLLLLLFNVLNNGFNRVSSNILKIILIRAVWPSIFKELSKEDN